jgi:hypothetical protein
MSDQENVLRNEERGRTMTTSTEKFCGAKKGKRSTRGKPAAEKLEEGQIRTHTSGIIDHKFVLLAGAKAAVDSDCQPCLEEIVHELEGAGVAEDDIRRAVKSGQLSRAYVIGQEAESACENEPGMSEKR